jgi:hypothetical protein
LVTPSGQDVSIGRDWRASMMAHSARDPYWMAGVRRELLDHPMARAEIEHECSRCHMPMAHFSQVAGGGHGEVFSHLRPAAPDPLAALAADGVSCTVCHQIQPDKLGMRASFNGHFTIDSSTPMGERPVFGPFAIAAGLERIMHSASAFRPVEGLHIRSSELCATCHTLFTEALDDQGKVIGQLPEQVPYQEWLHSAYRGTRSCQSCHMPVVTEPVRVASTLGDPRTDVARHTFRGGNFWMLTVLARFGSELGVPTPAEELRTQVDDTMRHLGQDSASLRIERLERQAGRLGFDVVVVNRAGHKLPTAYPSRRAWLHVVVRDETGAAVFESGAVGADGRIAGNDNDASADAYEPHVRAITRGDQVQIFESIMVDQRGTVTTGLLSGVKYVKDNRLLPDGFDKATASPDVAVHGDASDDPDFSGGGDRVRYGIALAGDKPVHIEAELLYQPIAFRWADNLRAYRAAETDRFVRMFDAMKGTPAARLAHASARH